MNTAARSRDGLSGFRQPLLRDPPQSSVRLAKDGIPAANEDDFAANEDDFEPAVFFTDDNPLLSIVIGMGFLLGAAAALIAFAT